MGVPIPDNQPAGRRTYPSALEALIAGYEGMAISDKRPVFFVRRLQSVRRQLAPGAAAGGMWIFRFGQGFPGLDGMVPSDIDCSAYPSDVCGSHCRHSENCCFTHL